MSSLFGLLFDCLGFAGALQSQASPDPTAATVSTEDALATITVGELSENIDFCPPADMSRPDQPISGVDETNAWRSDVYGWRGSSDPSRFEHITCRVRHDDFKGYVVLDSLEFGSGFGDTSFTPKIHASIRGTPIDLPLSNDARIASFTAKGTNCCLNDLWPLKSWNTLGGVHVFVYDVAFPKPTVTFTKQLPSSHADYPELQKFLAACARLDSAATPAPANDQSKATELVTDNLWIPAAVKIAGVLGDLANPGKLLNDIITLQAMTARIVVIVNLTPCGESNDFQPGQPGGVARLYPHVMVRSNFPLDYVDAAIRFTRPSKPKLLEGVHCGCDEMNDDMHALVVADSNRDNLQDTKPLMDSFPPPFWNNIFNYYVTDANEHLPPIVHVVRRREGRRTAWQAPILRRLDTDTQACITRTARQGAFDNIHMAPSMRLPSIVAIATQGNVIDVDATTRTAWKLDEITMAPFCIHDCFHLHWRWSDNSNEPGTFGFQGGKPNRQPGAPMVPENQDVDISVLAPNQLVYRARAWQVPPDEWQVFCHHGAGYLVSVGLPMKAAVAGLSVPGFLRPLADGSNVRFLKSKSFLSEEGITTDGELTPADSWAAFYWNVRYCNDLSGDAAGPTDRVIITDLQKVIDF